MPATKEQIRQIIADNNLNSAADVYSLLKDSFKDIFMNSWKQNRMYLWVMKRIIKAIPRHPRKKVISLYAHGMSTRGIHTMCRSFTRWTVRKEGISLCSQ